jgi:hypothetical protein
MLTGEMLTGAEKFRGLSINELAAIIRLASGTGAIVLMKQALRPVDFGKPSEQVLAENMIIAVRMMAGEEPA